MWRLVYCILNGMCACVWGGCIELTHPYSQDDTKKGYPGGTGGTESGELLVCRGCGRSFKARDGEYLSCHTYTCLLFGALVTTPPIDRLADLI